MKNKIKLFLNFYVLVCLLFLAQKKTYCVQESNDLLKLSNRIIAKYKRKSYTQRDISIYTIIKNNLEIKTEVYDINFKNWHNDITNFFKDISHIYTKSISARLKISEENLQIYSTKFITNIESWPKLKQIVKKIQISRAEIDKNIKLIIKIDKIKSELSKSVVSDKLVQNARTDIEILYYEEAFSFKKIEF